MRTKTVGAAVKSMKARMGLEDEVRLAREPEARVAEVGKSGLGGCVRRGVGRLVWGAAIGWGGIRNLRQCGTRRDKQSCAQEERRQKPSVYAGELGRVSHLP